MLVAGVDGGATHTRCAILDTRLESVWLGEAGPSNPVNIGFQDAARNITKCLSTALEKTGRDVGEIKLVVAGLAGVDSIHVRRDVEQHLRRLTGLNGRLVVEHDAHIALMHATHGNPGALVIAGTGSIVYVYTREGKRVVAGNRGWLLGDEGSGFWVARIALRRLRRTLDGLSRWDCLTATLAKKLAVTNTDELMYWFYLNRNRIDRVALVARYVVEAEEDCAAARRLLERASKLLACIAVKTIRKHLPDVKEVHYIGSMFKSRIYLETFEKVLARAGLSLTSKKIYPVVGALIIALQKFNIAFDDKLVIRVEKEVEKTKLY